MEETTRFQRARSWARLNAPLLVPFGLLVGSVATSAWMLKQQVNNDAANREFLRDMVEKGYSVKKTRRTIMVDPRNN